jgi:hypothetical protein
MKRRMIMNKNEMARDRYQMITGWMMTFGIQMTEEEHLMLCRGLQGEPVPVMIPRKNDPILTERRLRYGRGRS